MKQWFNLCLKLLLLLPFLGCSDLEDCFKSTGPITTEERTCGYVNYIELHNNPNFVYHYDSIYRLRVTAGSNLLDKISTSVENGRLVIRNRNRCNWMRSFNPDITVELWAPKIAEILVENASGDVTFLDTNKVDTFMFNSYGSIGTYELLLNNKQSYLKLHTGPADLIAKGHSPDHYIWNAGDGKMDCTSFTTNRLIAINRGSNDIYVSVDQYLEAYITSIGSIYYKGNPASINQNITGKGKLVSY